MSVKVLIVDDSGFFRRRLTDLINSAPDLEVVGTACNGAEAIDKARELRPDMITMDYEMPVLDGISAVRQIMNQTPTPILMFSSLTYEGARVTLDSLDAGAVDFLPKNFEEISKSTAGLKKKLFDAIRSVARSGSRGRGSASSSSTSSSSAGSSVGNSTARTEAAAPARPTREVRTPERKPAAAPRTATRPSPTKPRAVSKRNDYELVAIGTSTGGPVALQKVLTGLPANFRMPIVIVQHMPASFTPAFAERLDKLCKISVKEAEDGDVARPGLALLAPGGKQMMVGKRGQIKVLPGDSRLNYKPSVDVTFGSAANSYGGKVLGIILTGMGADGRDGSRLLKSTGADIWAQDEASSVIYGMPMAVADIADEILPLTDFTKRLASLC